MEESKTFTSRELEAIRSIRNWVAHRGRVPSFRELMNELKYRSPRSIQGILEQLTQKGVVKKYPDGSYQLVMNPDLGANHALTVNVPVVGTVAAGSPLWAEENIEAFIPVSVSLARPGSKYFLLHVRGDSMNRAGINDGDLVLVRQQSTADNGQKVVALIDDEATVKEYHNERGVVVLKPKSTNERHKPIILSDDFQIQGVVVATVPKLEGV